MPIYEYQCKECGVRFERIQSFSEEPVKVCPECEGETYRLIHSAGIIFKGSGFYVNDSKSSRKNLTKSKSANEKGAKNGKDSSGDTKKADDSTAVSSEKASSDD